MQTLVFSWIWVLSESKRVFAFVCVLWNLAQPISINIVINHHAALKLREVLLEIVFGLFKELETCDDLVRPVFTADVVSKRVEVLYVLTCFSL